MSCPSCFKDTTIREIFYGYPEDVDLERYVLGGCVIYAGVTMPQLVCIGCGWQDSYLDVAKERRRARRFVNTEEDLPGIEINQEQLLKPHSKEE